MPLRVLVAGSTGVVGRALLPPLREREHHVTALVRPDGQRIPYGDADAVVEADLLDVAGISDALHTAVPDVVVHQVTGFGTDPDDEAGLLRTARLRSEGTKNLVTAAASAGVARVIAQSTATANPPVGHDVLDEEAPLWTDAPGAWGEFVRAVATLEEAVLTNPAFEGVVLRYGALYGPGTSFAPGGAFCERVRDSALPLVADGAGLMSFTHVDDAASAVIEVLSGVEPGAYNVVDNEPAESTEWLPAYARMVGGPEPVELTAEQARDQLDWLTVHRLTEQRGVTNFLLRETVGWRPTWPSWREGLATLFGLWPG